MNTETAFLKAFAEEGDAVARLAYADWLEERDDPRAAWVRDDALFRWMLPDGDPADRIIAAAVDPYHLQCQEARDLLPRFASVTFPRLWQRFVTEQPEIWVAEAIGNMPPAYVEPLCEELFTRLRQESVEIWFPAAIAMRALKEAAAPALPDLMQRIENGMFAFETDDEWVDGVPELALTIARMGPVALPTLPRLIPLLVEADVQLVPVLEHFGPAAVPIVLEASADWVEDSNWQSLADWLQSIAADAPTALHNGLRASHPNPRLLASAGLSLVEPEAAMHVLVQLLTENRGRSLGREQVLCSAIQAAAPYVRPDTDALAASLAELHEENAPAMAQLLQELGETEVALRALRTQLTHPDRDQRVKAISTLCSLRRVSDDVVQAVLPLLEEADDYLLRTILRLFNCLPAEQIPLIEQEVILLIDSEHEDASDWAMQHLGRWATPRYREANHGCLANPTPRVRAAALWNQVLFGQSPDLDAAWGDPEAAVRAQVLRLAALTGSDRLSEWCRQGVFDTHREVRVAALHVVPFASLPPDEAVALLQSAFVMKEHEAQSALHSLADMALNGVTEVQSLIPNLVGLLSSDHRGAAAGVLAAIGAPAVPALLPTLTSGALNLPCSLLALIYMGEQAAAAAPLLATLLNQDNRFVAESLAHCLANIATPATPVQNLLDVLAWGTGDTLEYALTAIGRIGTVPWSRVAHLVDHHSDDLAACTVWVAGLLLPREEAVRHWRMWCNSRREIVRQSALLQLHWAGEGDEPSTEDLFAVAVVYGLRDRIAGMLAARAATDDECYRKILQRMNMSPHGNHGTALMALQQMELRFPEQTVQALTGAEHACHETYWRSQLYACIARVGLPSWPVLKMLWEAACNPISPDTCTALRALRQLTGFPASKPPEAAP
jgi:uncharacterized protein (TIGR02996 family)